MKVVLMVFSLSFLIFRECFGLPIPWVGVFAPAALAVGLLVLQLVCAFVQLLIAQLYNDTFHRD